MDDQGGSVKWRERFTGGGIKTPERLYGSIKAVDPATGEIKASQRLDYPNVGGALATAGNLVFFGLRTAPSPPMTPRRSRSCGASTSAPASTRHRSPIR